MGRRSDRLIRWFAAASMVAVVVALAGCTGGATSSSSTPAPPAQTSAATTQNSDQSQATPSDSSASNTPTTLNLKSASYTQKLVKDPSGYTSTVKITLWQPVPKGVQWPVAHPGDSTAVFPQPDGFDPSTDIVIPYELTLTNTTKGFDISDAKLAYKIATDTKSADQFSTPRSLDTFDWVDNSWQSNTWSVSINNTYGRPYVWAEMQQPNGGDVVGYPNFSWGSLASGESQSVVSFLVYHDQVTPAEPRGTKSALSHLALTALGPSALGTENWQKNVNLLGGHWSTESRP
jgi:hypothetical protein